MNNEGSGFDLEPLFFCCAKKYDDIRIAFTMESL